MSKEEKTKSGKPLESQPNNPLHGVKLATIVERLEAELGWDEMAQVTGIKAFSSNPSKKSALNFLRKTEWAREKIESLYLRVVEGKHFRRSSRTSKSKKFPFLREKKK